MARREQGHRMSNALSCLQIRRSKEAGVVHALRGLILPPAFTCRY